MQHPPSHVLLRQTLTMITPLIEYNEEMERLRGPLEPFAVKSATEEAAKERLSEEESSSTTVSNVLRCSAAATSESDSVVE